jgi:cation:H+ antiporter
MPPSTLFASLAFPAAAAVALCASFLLVTRLERFAARFRLSEATLGLLVALAADSPEITSAITASGHGQTSIGAGIVLGSNVFNLAALLGLGAMVAGKVKLHRRVVLLDGVTAAWVAVVALVVVSTGLGAPFGLVLVLAVVVPYFVVSTSSSNGLRRLGLPSHAVKWLRQAVAEEETEMAGAFRPARTGRFDSLVGIAALVVVIFASAVMERSAETLGKHFDLPSLVVGGIVLAAVTSLPNAVGAVYLASRGRGPAVLSEAMNSNMINVLVGLLLPGIFFGLAPSTESGILVGAWYACLTAVCLTMAFVGRGLSRRQGLIVVAGYAAFVVVAATR